MYKSAHCTLRGVLCLRSTCSKFDCFFPSFLTNETEWKSTQFLFNAVVFYKLGNHSIDEFDASQVVFCAEGRRFGDEENFEDETNR